MTARTFDELGVINRVVYPAGARIGGKERGEWMKLTDDESALITRLRGRHFPSGKRVGRTVRPAIERFQASVSVDPETGCWPWQAGITSEGYARFFERNAPGGHQHAHRFAYRHFVGPIPDGMTVDHVCHTNDPSCKGGTTCLHRRCVNPEHLELATRGDNARRGRHFLRERTHCKHGHEYTDENTSRDHKGARVCLACRRGRRKRAA